MRASSRTPPYLFLRRQGEAKSHHVVGGACVADPLGTDGGGQLSELPINCSEQVGGVALRSTNDLRGALITPTVTHRATIVEPKAVGALLRAIDGFEGQAVTRHALKLAPLVLVRPSELRQAEWTEFNLADAEWRIPAKKMNGRIKIGFAGADRDNIAPFGFQPARAVRREIGRRRLDA
jgi:integrase